MEQTYLIKMNKVIHQIWLGGEMPEKFKNYTQTWKNLNPDFEIKVWSEKELLNLNLENEELFNTPNMSFSEKSDIARYELLYKFGGVYCDTDFLPLKPINEFLEQFKENVLTFKIKGCLGTVGAILISKEPHNEIFKDLIMSLPENYKNNIDKGVLRRCGPVYLDNILSKHEGKFLSLGNEYFYPYGPRNPDRKIFESMSYDELKLTFPKAIAVHQWTGSWLKKNVKQL